MFGGIKVGYTKYLLGYSLGYLAITLMLYFIFETYSLKSLAGSLLGLVIFALVLKAILKKGN